MTAYFHSSKHVWRLVDMTYYCPGAELNCEEISHYVSWLEDLHTVKINYFPELDICMEDDIEGSIDIRVDVQTPPVRPLCEFLNHIYVFDIVYSKIFDN